MLLRGLLRQQSLALAATCVLFGTALVEYGTGPFLFRVAMGLAVTPILAVLLFRCGLLAFCSGAFMIAISTKVPLSLDPASWYFSQSLLTLLLVSGLALFAFRRALGGTHLLPGPVFED